MKKTLCLCLALVLCLVSAAPALAAEAVVPAGKYDYVDDFLNGFAAVCVGDPEREDARWGLIDETGREVIPVGMYSYLGAPVDDFGNLVVGQGDKYGVFRPNMGKEVVPCEYYWIYGAYDNYAQVSVRGDDGELEFFSVFFDAASTETSEEASGQAPDESGTAYPSTQEVEVDGRKIEFQCYALKDAAGNDTNYIKLRDLADILNGTAVQFEVGWDGSITITTGQSYTQNGTEQNTPFSGQRPYERTAVKTLVDGVEKTLDTFQLKDDNGGGYTYYKLRDLGSVLGITVDWTAQRGIYIETK